MNHKAHIRLIILLLFSLTIIPDIVAQTADWFDKVNVFSWTVQSYAPTTATVWGFTPYKKDEVVSLRELIDDHHRRGKLYFPTLHFIPLVDINLDNSLACIDINERIIKSPHSVPNLHHSSWQDTLINWAKVCIDIGADGLIIDGYANGNTAIATAGGSFDDSTMFDFRNYLASKYNDSELLHHFDIQDILNFNFGNWIKAHGLKSKWEIRPFYNTFPIQDPLLAEFWLFEDQYSADFFNKFCKIVKEYAIQKYGKNFLISQNSATYPYNNAVEFEDFVTGEFFYVWEKDEFEKRILSDFAATQIKINKASKNSPAVILIELTENTGTLKYHQPLENFYKYSLADIYSAGGTAIIYDDLTGPPYNKTFDVDLDVLSQYSSFLLNNGFLFENVTSSNKVAWVYSYSSKYNSDIVIEDWHQDLHFNWCYQGLSRILIDNSIQHDVIFFNDSRFSQNSISPDDWGSYQFIILPNTYSLTDYQVSRLLDFVQSGGTILSFANIGTHDEYGNKANRAALQSLTTPGTHSYGNGHFIYFPEDIGTYYKSGDSTYKKIIFEEIEKYLKPQMVVIPSTAASAFSYDKIKNSQKIIHLVNYNYFPTTDQFKISENFTIKMLIDTTKSWQVTCVSPDFFGYQVLETNYDLGYINIHVPKLEAYNIILLQENQNIPQLLARTPQNDTTIIGGNQMTFSVEVDDIDQCPLYYQWLINGIKDTTANNSTYYYQKERSYTGIDTVVVTISDGTNIINTQWSINNRPYKYPVIVFDEVHSPHFSPDSLRAIQLLINDEGPNFNPGHINMVWCNKLFKHLQKDFITEIDTLAPLSLDNSLHDVLFMVPCYKDISVQERETIRNFVADGGSMLILSTAFWSDAVKNTNSNTYKLLDYFGFKRNPYLLLADEQNQNTWNSGFYVNIKGNHPATASSRINCNLGHKLEVTTDFAQIIETTGDLQIIEDLNGNNKKDSNEPILSEVGIIGVSEYGKGRVVYITWHMFANDSEYKPNYDLVSNAMKWLTEKVNQIPTGIENSISSIPTFFELKQNYPNPFNPTTKIEFSLPKTSNVEIKIYNMLGQEIRTLVDKNYEAGKHIVIWDGKDNFGRAVSSGLYLYSMKSGDFVKVNKGLLLK